MRLDDLLRDPELLAGLDTVVEHACAERRGWYAIDPTLPSAPRCVHVRTFLADRDWGEGFRVETQPAFPWEQVRSNHGYPTVICAWPGDDRDAVLALAIALGKRAGRYLTAQVLPGMVRGIDERSGDSFDVRSHGRGATPIPIYVHASRGRRRVADTLPVRLELDLPLTGEDGWFAVDAGAVPVVPSRTTLRIDRSANRNVATVSVVVDVVCKVSGEDQLAVSIDGQENLRLVRYLVAPGESDRSSSDAGPRDLHVLFDRTTLDPESFVDALSYSPEATTTDAENVLERASSATVRRTADWNRGLRGALGRALEPALPAFGANVRLHVWWFADRPRLEMSTALPHEAVQAYASDGPCQISQFAEKLRMFGWVSGIDLADAVDECLDAVAAQIAANGFGAEAAVLVVGDSPPPPSDTNDPLWACVADGPQRANSRTSDTFVRALARLHEASVPVAWLFVRDNAPDVPDEHAGWYRERRRTNEAVLAGLQSVKRGLLVQPAHDREELEEDLRKLFHRMRQADTHLAWVEIRGAGR